MDGTMRVLVVGAGRVGLVAAAGLAHDGHEVVCAEEDSSRLRSLRSGHIPFFEPGLNELVTSAQASGRLTFVQTVAEAPPCDMAMIAVGTPSGTAGQVDLSFVESAMHQIVGWAQQPLVLAMKSSVPPGTGAQLDRQYLRGHRMTIDYVANPEFLREGQAVEDWFHPTRTVIGAQTPRAFAVMREVYDRISAPVYEMDVTTAEMVKYGANAFLATKVSFINEIANLCDAVGADVEIVASAMGADPRIGPHYLRPGVGYGGSCFPKDTQALDVLADGVGYRFRLLKAVIEVNAHQGRLAVDRVMEILGHDSSNSVAVLGLSFKPGTDDIRESPALDIIASLRDRGVRVVAYDPVAAGNARRVLPRDVRIIDDPYEACRGARAIMVLTAWAEILTLDWTLIRQKMSAPYLIYDGRNCLPDTLSSDGLLHVRVGRPRGREAPRPLPLGARSR